MATGYFALVLHAHLPFVRHPEDPTVMEEQWLYEAITGTYLPLLQMFEGLIADHVPYRCTVSLSAPLITMLTDDLLKVRYAEHLDKLIELAEKEIERTKPEPHYQRLAHMYHDRFQSLRHTWRCHEGDLVRAFRRLQDAGPRRGHHLDGDARVLPADGPQLGQHPRPGPRRRRSLREALRPPPARHVAGRVRLRPRRRRAAARGGDPLLLRRHARHPVRRSPPGLRRLRAALLPERRRRVRPRHRVVASRCGARKEGYPGDPHYRDFYRDIGFDLPIDYIEPYIHPEGHRVYTGIKYHAITHDQLHDKWVYDPDIARGKAGLHASHFRGNREKQVQHLRGAHGSAADHHQPLRRRALRPLVVRGADLPRRPVPPAALRPERDRDASRRATTSIATPPTRSRRRARRRGASRATTTTG